MKVGRRVLHSHSEATDSAASSVAGGILLAVIALAIIVGASGIGSSIGSLFDRTHSENWIRTHIVEPLWFSKQWKWH